MAFLKNSEEIEVFTQKREESQVFPMNHKE